MTDNIAVLEGFTKELTGSSAAYDLHIMVKPDTELDGNFKAWCMDEQEFIFVRGWLFVFEEVKA